MFRNMKISITDETHLKAVCDVLETLGYHGAIGGSRSMIICSKYGRFTGVEYCNNNLYIGTTLPDLLKMRDEMIRDSIYIGE